MGLLRQVPNRNRKLTIAITEELEQRLEAIKRRCQEQHMELPFQAAFEAFLGKLLDDAEAELTGTRPGKRRGDRRACPRPTTPAPATSSPRQPCRRATGRPRRAESPTAPRARQALPAGLGCGTPRPGEHGRARSRPGMKPTNPADHRPRHDHQLVLDKSPPSRLGRCFGIGCQSPSSPRDQLRAAGGLPRSSRTQCQPGRRISPMPNFQKTYSQAGDNHIRSLTQLC